MGNLIVEYLKEFGPSRSSSIVQFLIEKHGINPEAARQRVSRAGKPVRKFPYSLLPNREGFVYLESQRREEDFWINFYAALTQTNSVYGAALQALICRGGYVKKDEFSVISGCPIALKNQITHDQLVRVLILCELIAIEEVDGQEYVVFNIPNIFQPDFTLSKARYLAETIIISALGTWLKKIGFVSFNKVQDRNSEGARLVGSFKWDLTAPSYLLPMKGGKGSPGFVVADVFANATITKGQIKYFLRKLEIIKNVTGNDKILGFLVAENLDLEAMREANSVGISLARIEDLFGKKISRALNSLIYTLTNAAAIATGNPNRVIEILDDLSEIEGAASNLRGALFELIAAHLAKIGASSIDLGKKVIDQKTGEKAEIDILRVVGNLEYTAIECKGRNPGGVVDLEEVEHWIEKLSVVKSYLKARENGNSAAIKFELWTSGDFTPEALQKLEAEKAKRKRIPIDWFNGKAVVKKARDFNETAIVEALNQHFIKHPLANIKDKKDENTLSEN